MTEPLRFEPEANRELDEAARWYEAQRSGLGQRFLDEVAATLKRVVAFPTAGAPVPYAASALAARRAPVARFPYHVIYIDTPAVVRVLAIAHDRRKPGYWIGHDVT